MPQLPHTPSILARRRADRQASLAGRSLAWALAALLVACGGGGGDTPTVPPEPPPTTLGKPIGSVEIDITGLGTAKPGSSMRWDGASAQKQAQGLAKSAAAASPSAAIAATTNLPGGLDIQFQSASSIDTGSRPGGTRYISVTYRVRNAQFSGTAGSGTAYDVARSNLTFLAVIPSTGISGSAITRFVRFDNSAADPALALQLVPTHGMNSTATAVEASRASMQVYRETELPPVDASVSDVLPYGFVVHNANDGSRTLPANPAVGQFDGLVTFAFKLPLQATAELDPFKITMRFQVMEDSNTRVTRSLEDTDASASARAAALGATDLAVLCDKVLNLPTTNPICSVRLAGPAAAPTARISTATPAGTLKIVSSPGGLANMPTTAEIVLATSQDMNVPTATTLVVNGSHSGRRTLTGAYAGVLDGGGSTGRPNNLIFRLRPEDRPFFAGEVVTFTATTGNLSTGGSPLPAFAGRFNTRGASVGALGGFGAAASLDAGTTPQSVVMADFNGDGRLDVASASTAGVNVSLGNSSGGLDAAVNFAISTNVSANRVSHVTAADLNNDGKLDIVAFGSDGVAFYRLIGDGAGGFATAVRTGTNVAGSSEVRVIDFNRDGNLDIVVLVTVALQVGGTRPAVSVYLGRGDGTFNGLVLTRLTANAAIFTNMLVDDFNGDGRPDIAAITGASVIIYLGNGVSRFGGATNDTTPAQSVATLTVSAAASGMAVGDVNDDGKPDLLVTSPGNAKVHVLIGSGTGGFAAPVAYDTGTSPQTVALADLNGDGRLDIVVANGGGTTVSVFLNTGGGLFAPAAPYTVGASPRGLALGDLDGDGKLDLVAGSSGTSATQLSRLPGN